MAESGLIWKESTAAIARKVKDRKEKEIKRQKLPTLTERARQIRAKAARPKDMAIPAIEEVETLATQVGLVAKHIAEGFEAYSPVYTVHGSRAQAYGYRKDATKWALAVRDMA